MSPCAGIEWVSRTTKRRIFHASLRTCRIVMYTLAPHFRVQRFADGESDSPRTWDHQTLLWLTSTNRDLHRQGSNYLGSGRDGASSSGDATKRKEAQDVLRVRRKRMHGISRSVVDGGSDCVLYFAVLAGRFTGPFIFLGSGAMSPHPSLFTSGIRQWRTRRFVSGSRRSIIA